MTKQQQHMAMRLAVLLALAATSAYAGSIAQFFNGLAADVIASSTNLGIVILILGALGMLAGARLTGIVTMAGAAFVLLGATPIANWLKSLAG